MLLDENSLHSPPKLSSLFLADENAIAFDEARLRWCTRPLIRAVHHSSQKSSMSSLAAVALLKASSTSSTTSQSTAAAPSLPMMSNPQLQNFLSRRCILITVVGDPADRSVAPVQAQPLFEIVPGVDTFEHQVRLLRPDKVFGVRTELQVHNVDIEVEVIEQRKRFGPELLIDTTYCWLFEMIDIYGDGTWALSPHLFVDVRHDVVIYLIA